MIVVLAFAATAGPVDCDALVGHTVDAARYLSQDAPDSEAILAVFAAEQQAACDNGWTPSADIVMCISTQTDPEEILACEEELRTDLEAMWLSARTQDLAVR